MERAHDIDQPSGYCRKCGVSWQFAVDAGIQCIEAENVSGISHLRAQRKNNETLRFAAAVGEFNRRVEAGLTDAAPLVNCSDLAPADIS